MSLNLPASAQPDALARLRGQVVAANNDPQDALDVAAILESLGWTDQSVASAFGFPTIFDCAEELYRDIRTSVSAHPLPAITTLTPRALARQLLVELIHGITFTWPMFVSIGAMVTLHLSFSGYSRFPLTTATAIALGTFLSFLATGGFSQAMTHLYYVLMGLHKHEEAAGMVFRLVGLGLAATCAFGLALVAVDAVFPLLPASIVALAVLYMCLLGGMWLSFGGLYILRHEYLLALTTGLAILVTYLLFRNGLPMIAAQSGGMVAGSLATLGLFALLVRRALRRAGTLTQSVLGTRLPQMVHSALPYFLYGLIYFVFIYFDRLVAWSSQTAFLPFNIWFRGTYELGMDWALISLIVPLSAVEVFMGQLHRVVGRAAERLGERQRQLFAHRVRRWYVALLALEFGLAAGGLIGARVLIAFLARIPLFAQSVPVHGPEGIVFLLGSISYSFLAVALFNVLLLFTWALPQPALRLLLYGLVADATVGILATRILGPYWYAVLGLVAGSLLAAGLSVREILRTLPSLDYVLYRLT